MQSGPAKHLPTRFSLQTPLESQAAEPRGRCFARSPHTCGWKPPRAAGVGTANRWRPAVHGKRVLGPSVVRTGFQDELNCYSWVARGRLTTLEPRGGCVEHSLAAMTSSWHLRLPPSFDFSDLVGGSPSFSVFLLHISPGGASCSIRKLMIHGPFGNMGGKYSLRKDRSQSSTLAQQLACRWSPTCAGHREEPTRPAPCVLTCLTSAAISMSPKRKEKGAWGRTSSGEEKSKKSNHDLLYDMCP